MAGVVGAILAGAAVLTWSFGLFAASFGLFGGPTTKPPEPGHLLLMYVAAPALLGLATVPITLILGAGRGRAYTIALAACATGTVASMQASDGSDLEGGVGTFLTVAIAVPALAALAACVGGDRNRDDAAAVAGGLAPDVSVLALLIHACSQSSPPLALLFGARVHGPYFRR